MSASPTLALACELIRRASVTPDDAGCQALVAGRLAPLGFRVEPMRFGDVDNLWARHGNGAPLLLLLGHTDIVPPARSRTGAARRSSRRFATDTSTAAARRT